jgi:hypothetical protein
VVTITAVNRQDQTFVNWTTTTPGVEFADATATITTFVMPACEVDIIANFQSSNSIDKIMMQADMPYTIYDISGVPVAKGITNGNTLPGTGLPKGVYVIQAGGRSSTIIIQK